MGGFGVPGCTKSSRKPEYSPILTPGGRSERCQRHRGLKDQPAAEADTFGLALHHWNAPDQPRSPNPPSITGAVSPFLLLERPM